MHQVRAHFYFPPVGAHLCPAPLPQKQGIGGEQWEAGSWWLSTAGEMGSLHQYVTSPSPVRQWPPPWLAPEDRVPATGSVQGGRSVNANYKLVLKPLLVVVVV